MGRKTDKTATAVALWRIVAAVIVLLVGAGIFCWKTNSLKPTPAYDITEILPTCTENGYRLYRNRNTGETSVRDISAALGHRFSTWSVRQPVGALSCGLQVRTCEICNLEEQQIIYPELTVACLGIEGDLNGIGKKSEVPVDVHFVSENLAFDCYGTIKHQGHSSLQYDKKNFTLKLFQDEGRTEKNKIVLEHWNKENKFILKANYTDPSQCRNLVCADIWADMCKSRDGLSPRLKALANCGAVDGFPIALYISGEFHGLYTMNLHKDDDLFGMEDGEQAAIMILNGGEAEEAKFRAIPAFAEDSPWEVEYCGTEDATWAQEQLSELFHFVMNSDDTAFRKELHTQLDVPSAIDYLLAIYTLGLQNSGTKDVVLVTYEETPWIASLYDMENAFGLHQDGNGYDPADQFLPQCIDGRWDSGTGSLLWDRLLQNFEPEIRSRYQALRQTVFTQEGLCERVLAFMDGIPDMLYEAEQEQNSKTPLDVSQSEQITTYIVQRLQVLDCIFGEEG